MKKTELAKEVVEVAVAMFDRNTQIQIDEWISNVTFPKGWSFAQRFLFLKSHFRDRAKKTGRDYKFIML